MMPELTIHPITGVLLFMWLVTGVLSLLAWGQLGVFCGLTALDDTIGDICLDVKLQSGFGMTNFAICTYTSFPHITSARV